MPGGAGPMATSANPFKTRIVTREYYVAFGLVTSLFFLWGFCYGLLDVLNSHFQQVLGITKLQSTGLQVAYFGIGYFAFSPVAGEVLRRKGYKFAIIMGLCLYSTGAILFWPVAKFSGGDNKQAIFAGFVVLTGLTACGLATLEVTANSYITVMPPAGPAAYRLQFSQSWNGVASFVGPLIASKFFFSGGNENNLDNVQWVYLAVSGMGIILAVTFFFVRLPEVSEADLQAEVDALAESPAALAAADQLAKPFIRQTRPMLGFLAQFMYVGAQVAIGALFINYARDAGMTKPQASNFLSYALIIFTVGRFISTALLTVISAPALLMINATLAAVFIAVVSTTKGMAGVGCLMIVYFLMACMYPVIFVISTANLGRHTRRAASLLVAGVSGGAVLTPLQGAIATYYDTHKSMWVSFPAFLYVAFFGFYCWRTQSGSAWTRSGELAHQVALAGGAIIPAQKTALDLEGGSNDGDEKKTLEAEEFQVERVERH